jgi:hypothetical protein
MGVRDTRYVHTLRFNDEHSPWIQRRSQLKNSIPSLLASVSHAESGANQFVNFHGRITLHTYSSTPTGRHRDISAKDTNYSPRNYEKGVASPDHPLMVVYIPLSDSPKVLARGKYFTARLPFSSGLAPTSIHFGQFQSRLREILHKCRKVLQADFK